MSSEHELTIGNMRLPDLSGLGRGLSLLVVEDDDDDACLIETILEDDPRVDKCVRAVDGEAALELLRDARKSPDLVLVDINMPKCDGFQFLERMREMDLHRTTPVVMLTSSSLAKDFHKSLMAKANAFATKPNTYDEFAKLLRSMVKQIIWEETLPPLLSS